MKFVVEIGRRYLVEVPDRGPDSTVRVDEKDVFFDLRSCGPDLPMTLILDGRSFDVEVSREDGIVRIAIDGKEFLARVADERRERLNQLIGRRVGSNNLSGEVKAPMPGLVVKVEVMPGDRIAKGQGLLIIEAMKMENEIKSSLDGTIGKIHVGQGQPVEKGQSLVSII